MLSERVRKLLETAGSYEEILLCAISIWECCMLLEKKRIEFDAPPEEWLEKALDESILRVVPLSAKVCLKAVALPGTFHKDPADRLIVATALIEEATLITRDAQLREYAYVQSLW